MSVRTETDKKTDNTHANKEEAEIEFGGPVGAASLIVFSHVLPYYLYLSNFHFGGTVFYPDSLSDIGPWFGRLWGILSVHAAPTRYAALIYLSFLAFEALLALTMPGVVVRGLPIRSENGKRLTYYCNGLASWLVSLATVALLHWSKLFRLTEIFDNFGSLMSVAIISADLIALGVYLSAFVYRKAIRVTGNVIYDFFMGVNLNPRFLTLDIKMWAEIRVSWTLLFFLTLSCAAKQYQQYGFISGPMWFMLTAHFLYTHACQKGEECIPTTWDISYEAYGWMLTYWNLCGVAFVYCYQSVFIYHRGPNFTHSTAYLTSLFVVLLSAYYVWDTANSQKNRFRMKRMGEYTRRPWAFPQLPWGTLENPSFIKCKNGGTLLTDGWYRYARKIHYTADTIMALLWGLSCGTSHFLPFFYPVFFLGMIVHRGTRDMQRCAKKYGEDWKTYCQTVPYKFIPFIY